MSVYVDDGAYRYGRMVMCHMVADSEAELHTMADHIGVARRWLQAGHYDVCRSMRRRAVEGGAKEISQREAVEVRRRMMAYEKARRP